MRQIDFKKKEDVQNFDGYIILYNYAVEFTYDANDVFEYLKVFALRHNLNSSSVINNSLILCYKLDGKDKIIISPDKKSDLITFARDKGNYLKVLKNNLNKSVLNFRMKK